VTQGDRIFRVAFSRSFCSEEALVYTADRRSSRRQSPGFGCSRRPNSRWQRRAGQSPVSCRCTARIRRRASTARRAAPSRSSAHACGRPRLFTPATSEDQCLVRARSAGDAAAKKWASGALLYRSGSAGAAGGLPLPARSRCICRHHLQYAITGSARAGLAGVYVSGSRAAAAADLSHFSI